MGPTTVETVRATLDAYFAERPRDAARHALHRELAAAFALLPYQAERAKAAVDAFLRARI